jgi:dTDP-4-dehydrorhamnose 3,5-epimerase
VPPNIGFGFKGLHNRINMITNIADIPHDPDEMMRKKIDDIEMDWSIE